jgi:hypothetical protein
LRGIRAIVNEALAVLEREVAALYSPMGRPSIPPLGMTARHRFPA